MSKQLNVLYEFEEFLFESETGTLWRDDEIVPLPPKATVVLRTLIESDGRLVTKQELLDCAWADTFVEEAVLTQSVYLLRQALGGASRQFIKTVARRGYRFGVTVKRPDPTEVLPVEPEMGAVVRPAVLENKSAAPLFVTLSPINRDVDNITDDDLKVGRSVTWSLKSRLFMASAMALLVAAAGYSGYWFFGGKSDEKAVKIAPIEQLRFQRLTDSGDVVYPTISPNGEMLAYVRLEDEQGSVWIKQIATNNAVSILPSSREGYRSLTFSPDGKYLFFRKEADGGSVFQTTILGGTPKRVAENVWSDFGISPDGSKLSFIRRDISRKRHSIILSNLDGSGERELAFREAPSDFRSTPSFSPEGDRVLVVSGKRGQALPQLVEVKVADAAEVEIATPRWRTIQRVMWMPNGKSLIISARDAQEPYSQLWLLSYPSGEVRRLTNDLEAYFWISLSADGSKIVTRQQRIFSHLWLLPDGDLRKARQLTSGGRNLDGYSGVSWAADKRIIYTGFSNNVTDIFAMNADGSGRVQLTENAGLDNNLPSVSPDGKRVVFTSNRGGVSQVFLMDIDGQNQRALKISAAPGERLQSPVFSNDGTEIFYIKRGEDSPAIWKVPVEGGEEELFWRPAEGSADSFVSISTDGSQIAFHNVTERSEARRETQTFRVSVAPVDKKSDPLFFDLPLRRPYVQWASATAFDYATGSFNSSVLYRQSITGDAPQKLIDFPDRVFGFAWSDDRKDLLVVRGKQSGDALMITNLP